MRKAEAKWRTAIVSWGPLEDRLGRGDTDVQRTRAAIPITVRMGLFAELLDGSSSIAPIRMIVANALDTGPNWCPMVDIGVQDQQQQQQLFD